MNRAAILLASLLAPLFADAALAQSFLPAHPVKIIVPFPGGGGNDVLARIVGDKLQAKWSQPVVIENKSGAGGNIGADLAYQSEPRRLHAASGSARTARHQSEPLQTAELQAT